LGIGGPELVAAARAGRELTRREPYRETGHRLLMSALARQGNAAEALLVYDQLRTRLHDDLGVAPSAQTQELHKQLLR
jgi:pentatricopeptide repeat protein